MKTKIPFVPIILMVMILSCVQLASGAPCIWRKKQSAITEKEEHKIVFMPWMFNPVEWETNERLYIQLWMYVIQPYCEMHEYNIKEWMWDVSHGWLDSEEQPSTTVIEAT